MYIYATIRNLRNILLISFHFLPSSIYFDLKAKLYIATKGNPAQNQIRTNNEIASLFNKVI